MYKTVTAADLRQRLSHHLMRVSMGGMRLLITRNNRDFAALVQVRDLDAMERAEKACAELQWSNQQRAFMEFMALKKTLQRDVEDSLSGRRPAVPPPKTW
jgi:prevent-host-death family protein